MNFITLRVVVNHRRAASITEHAVAVIRRARKRDRPALFARFVRELAECVRIVDECDRVHGDA